MADNSQISEFSDPQLVELVKTQQSSEAITELQKRHSGLICSISQKYSSKAGGSGIQLQDFLDDAQYLVYKAALEYDETKAKFNTFLGNSVRFFCLDKIRDQNKYVSIISDQKWDNLDNELPDFKAEDDKELGLNIDFVKDLLSQVKDEKVKKVINLRYFSGGKKVMPATEVAERLGVTSQHVLDLQERFFALARAKFNSDSNNDVI